mmetsp:Transcript_50310/g.107757  ORF Transcript_50310/g.107757 Transcript_50310/m.107757 type:complete len:129 (+) Transcript_50310:59-445(+)
MFLSRARTAGLRVSRPAMALSTSRPLLGLRLSRPTLGGVGIGEYRVVHKSYFTRWLFGSICFLIIVNHLAEQQYQVPRFKDANILWPWWLEQMALKRQGKIPEDTPGYALVKWNDAHERRLLEEGLPK